MIIKTNSGFERDLAGTTVARYIADYIGEGDTYLGGEHYQTEEKLWNCINALTTLVDILAEKGVLEARDIVSIAGGHEDREKVELVKE